MAAERVGELEVYASLEDRDLIAGLRRAEAEFERTRAKIAGSKAEADISADIEPLKRKLKEAEAALKKFEKAAAQAKIAGDDREARKALQTQQRIVTELRGERDQRTASLKAQKTSNAETVRAAALAVAQSKLEAARANALEQQQRRREVAAKRANDAAAKAAREQARADAQAEAAALKRVLEAERLASIEQRNSQRRMREETRLAATQERAAIQRQKAAERAHYDATVGIAKERAQIASLKREYARLTDAAERAGKRRAYTVEGTAKLDLDRSSIAAKMESVKAQLNHLGAHPPVEIQVEVERRKSMSRARRSAAEFGDIFRFVFEKVANLGSLAIRIGPFTGTLKQFGIALGFLGPLILDVLGAAGSLVGVLGAGLAGASTVGAAGLLGLGLGFGGLKLSMHSAEEEYKLAKTATDAYTRAVAKHGEGSKQAKKAQKEMNSVLRHVGPLAREAARGASMFRMEWDAATKPTRKALGSITKGFYGALRDVTPLWASSTNKLSSILDKNLRNGFKFFKSPEFRNNFRQITDNFNASMPSLLHALGSFGRAFLNFAREGSKFLEPFTGSLDKLGSKLLSFTQRDDFGATIKRWASYAADLGRFFGALGRVVMHFFGAGAGAGDRFVVSMTNALNRWDKFLTSTRGKNEIADGFDRAVSGVQALWAAIAPIGGAFITWASNISPFIAALLRGISLVTSLLTGVSKMLGLGGPLAALASTFAAIWAVGKIGAFVAMMARIPIILRQIQVASGTMAAVGAVFNGRLLAGMRGGAGAASAVAVAGGQAGAAMRAGIQAGGATAAAEMRGAMMAGGRAAAGMAGVSGAVGAATGARRGAATVIPAVGGIGNATRAGAAAGAAAGGLTKMARAGNAAKAGLAGLGALALGVSATGAGLAVAAVAAAGGIYYLATRTKEWEKNLKSSQGHLKNYRTLTAGMRDGNMSLAGSSLQLAQGQLNLNSALRQSAAEERQLDAMRKQGKRGTDEYRDAVEQHRQTVLNLKDARLQEIVSERNRTQMFRDQKKAIAEATAESDKAVDKAKQAVTKTLSKYASSIAMGGKPDAYVKSLKALSEAEAVASQQAASAAVNMANLERAMQGLAPMANSAGKALATVQKLGGKELSTKISLKFQDPGQAARVAASAAKSLKGGVPKTVTSRIVADSRNAEQAIRRLQAARITPKKLQIIESGGKAAIRVMEQIVGRRLTQKEQRIVERGGKDVLTRLAAIGSKDLPTKTQNIRESGAGGVVSAIGRVIARAAAIRNKTVVITARDNASGVAGGVAAAIARIQSKTVTVTVRRVGGVGGAIGKASGGVVGLGDGAGASQPNERQIERAAITASMSGARKTTGGKYSQPTLLIGEENRSEIVVSTNPKYRKRNLAYLGMAARALGQTIQSAAAGKRPPAAKKPAAPKPDVTGAGGFGSFSGGAFNPKAILQPTKVFKPTKKKAAKIKSNRGWATYIEGLQTQQGYWEREVGIRESQIREPENMVVRAPENDKQIRDPATGETTTVEAFKANPEIESSYKPSLAAVLDAMRTLMSIVMELVRAIPQAILANKQERAARHTTVDNLTSQIGMERNRMRGSKGATRQKHEKRISTLADRREREKEQITKLKEDEGTLGEARVDAGFDVREVGIAASERQREYDSASGRAAAQAAEQSAVPSGGSGGGGGGGGGADGGSSSTATLGIEAQTALALQQNAQTLSAFGSNFISAAGSMAQFAAGAVAGAGAGGSGGMMANPAVGGPRAAADVGLRSAIIGSNGASAAMGASGGSSVARGGGAASATESGTTNVRNTTVNNTFMAPPPDAHTWSKGVEFELGATI